MLLNSQMIWADMFQFLLLNYLTIQEEPMGFLITINTIFQSYFSHDQ